MVTVLNNHMNPDELPLLPAFSKMCKMNTEWKAFLGALHHTASLLTLSIVCQPASVHLALTLQGTDN